MHILAQEQQGFHQIGTDKARGPGHQPAPALREQFIAKAALRLVEQPRRGRHIAFKVSRVHQIFTPNAARNDPRA